MLARAGRRDDLVDADVVALSNINRQLVATHKTIGQPKCDVLAERLQEINPEIKLHVLRLFVKDEATDELLDRAKYDVVLDAIDSLSPQSLPHSITSAKACALSVRWDLSQMGSLGDPSGRHQPKS